jgi:peptidoglycan hydrolase-like protein with peptidoglycan-binding domain
MKSNALVLAAVMTAFGAVPTAFTQPAPVLTYVQPLTPQAIREVQDQLRKLGAYTGRVDGIWGGDSQAALQKFQQSHGLDVTDELNQVTVTMLGLNRDQLLAAGQVAPALPATSAAAGSPSPAVIRAVQEKLRELNYYAGSVDGVWGADTQDAIEHYQQGRGLQANGQLNPATLAALGIDPNSIVGAAPP